jgi:hypothetical protein
MERIIQILRISNKKAKRNIKINYIKSKEIINDQKIFGNQKVFVSFNPLLF